ncbi:flagellar export chaperone FlgN [Hungatella hathewayi]|uniref:flagellar export chaperone FlgN n=1 Tax=Hungatella hathewayi TaxID=154046 RepID=UPI0035631D08
MNRQSDRCALLDQFNHTISALIDVVREITDLENEKASIASSGHHVLIDECIKKEQACILKLRGLEHKRMRAAEPLGWKDLTFRQILEQCEDSEAESLQPLFSELDNRIDQLLNARDSADRIIRSRLQEMELLLSRQTGESYDGTGKGSSGIEVHLHDQFV